MFSYERGTPVSDDGNDLWTLKNGPLKTRTLGNDLGTSASGVLVEFAASLLVGQSPSL